MVPLWVELKNGGRVTTRDDDRREVVVSIRLSVRPASRRVWAGASALISSYTSPIIHVIYWTRAVHSNFVSERVETYQAVNATLRGFTDAGKWQTFAKFASPSALHRIGSTLPCEWFAGGISVVHMAGTPSGLAGVRRIQFLNHLL
jgi:hypothetical protein